MRSSTRKRKPSMKVREEEFENNALAPAMKKQKTKSNQKGEDNTLTIQGKSVSKEVYSKCMSREVQKNKIILLKQYFRKYCTKVHKRRLKKAKNSNMGIKDVVLINNSQTSLAWEEIKCTVIGRASDYLVHISQRPSCNCPDFSNEANKYFCKHIMLVLLKVIILYYHLLLAVLHICCHVILGLECGAI